MFKILSIALIISYLFSGCRSEADVIDSQSPSGDSSKDNNVETITILENNGTEIVEKKVPITEFVPIVRDNVEQNNPVQNDNNSNNSVEKSNPVDEKTKKLYAGFSKNLELTDFKNNSNFYSSESKYQTVQGGYISSSEIMYVSGTSAINTYTGQEYKNKNVCTTKSGNIYQMSKPCSTIKDNRDKIIKDTLGKNYAISNDGKDLDVYRYEYTFTNNSFRLSGALYGVKNNNTINVIGGLYGTSTYSSTDIISIDFGTNYYESNGDYQYKDPVVLDNNNKPKSGVVSVYINNKLDDSYDLSTLSTMDADKKQKLKDLNLFNID